MSGSARCAVGLGVMIACLAGHASADVKIAFIDPLSGGAAATGILAQKTHQFYIDAINAAGGLNGEKLELLSFDNKVNPQESLIQLKRALDDGARYVVQGNGSSVALAITDAVQKYNERNRAAVALHDVARAIVERALQLDQRFLRIDLVVERQELELLAVETASRVDRVDVELVRFLRQNAGAGGAAGQWIDESDLDVGCGGRGNTCDSEAQPDDVAGGSDHGASLFRLGPVLRRRRAGPSPCGC